MRALVIATSAAALFLTGLATADAASNHRTGHRHHYVQTKHHHRYAHRPWYFGRSQDWAAAPRAYRRDRADFDGWVTDKGIH
jgi:hypothetical protein